MNSNDFVCIIFYDVSTEQSAKKEYRRMRHYIITNGFYMIQESVYARRGNNRESFDAFLSNLKLFKYEQADIKSLILTQNIFDELITITGETQLFEQLLDNKTFIVEL